MTSMRVAYDGATFVLTDEKPDAADGEPVLVAADGRRFRGKNVVATLPAEPETFFFVAVPERPLYARDLVEKGDLSDSDGETCRDEHDRLTDYGRATLDLYRRFRRQ